METLILCFLFYVGTIVVYFSTKTYFLNAILKQKEYISSEEYQAKIDRHKSIGKTLIGFIGIMWVLVGIMTYTLYSTKPMIKSELPQMSVEELMEADIAKDENFSNCLNLNLVFPIGF